MPMKINKLEIENVKRVKAVKIEPNQNGLTIIGGKNNQGKTSVLDSIAWALGGERYKPSQSTREGSLIPPNLHIVMNNGLVVERKGKNIYLVGDCEQVGNLRSVVWGAYETAMKSC